MLEVFPFKFKMLKDGQEYDGRYDITVSYRSMQNAEKMSMPFPSVILANHVFVRPLISQDLCTFISTFRSKYLRRRIGFPVSDKNTPELLNEFFLTVLSSYKSISLTFLFMIAEIETFEPVGILSFHPMGLVLSEVPFSNCDPPQEVANSAVFSKPPDTPLSESTAGSGAPPAGKDITPALIELSPDTPCVEVLVTFDHGYRRHGYDKDIMEAVTRYCLRHGCVPLFAHNTSFDPKKFTSKTSMVLFKTEIACRFEDAHNYFFLAYIPSDKQ